MKIMRCLFCSCDNRWRSYMPVFTYSKDWIWNLKTLLIYRYSIFFIETVSKVWYRANVVEKEQRPCSDNIWGNSDYLLITIFLASACTRDDLHCSMHIILSSHVAFINCSSKKIVGRKWYHRLLYSLEPVRLSKDMIGGIFLNAVTCFKGRLSLMLCISEYAITTYGVILLSV